MGEYEYRVTAVRLRRDGIELDGSLGQWQTTMVLEPKDVAPVARWLGVAVGVALVVRLLR